MHGTDESRAVAGPAAAKIRRVSGDESDRVERIRERAYHLWERAEHLHEVDHWLQAEREIDAGASPAPAVEPKTKTKSATKPTTKAKPKRKPKTQET
jgi:hypothetical protein